MGSDVPGDITAEDLYVSLARWDVVVVQAAWTEKQLAQLRANNPNIKIYIYVLPYEVTYPTSTDDAWHTENTAYADAHDLWWYRSDGTIASDWPGMQMVNITSEAPNGPQGSWRQYLADRVEDLIRSRPSADGIYFDNYFDAISWNQPTLQLDSDRDGVADTNTHIDHLWNAALNQLATDVRSRFDPLEGGRERPLSIIGNAANDYFEQLNGRLYELFPTLSMADYGNPYGYSWNYDMFGPAGYLVSEFRTDPYRVGIINTEWQNGDLYDPAFADAADRELFERHKRFTLVSTLLGNGYYSLDQGRNGNRNLWWEPEFDNGGRGKGYLGFALGGPYRTVEPSGSEILQNGHFSQGLTHWIPQVNSVSGEVTAETDETARMNVTKVTASGGNLKFSQYPLSITANHAYTISFRAKAGTNRKLVFDLYSDQCPGSYCMAVGEVTVHTTWETHEVSFISPATATPGLDFLLAGVGTIWLDDVSFKEGNSAVFRRDFENGTVLLNYTATSRTVDLGATFRRLDVPGSDVWDGATVTKETVPPWDGRILLSE